MPPIDFYMMMGLPMGDMPPSTNDDDVDMVNDCIGPQQVEYYKGTKRVLTSWFEKSYVWATNESTDTETNYFV